MTIQNEQLKIDKLALFLFDLSHSQALLKDIDKKASFYDELEKIYYSPNEEKFHIRYSDIFSSLSGIDYDTASGSLDVLAQNLYIIKRDYKAVNKDKKGNIIDIKDDIFELYEHVNLEIGIINYTRLLMNDAQSALAENQDKMVKLQESFDNKTAVVQRNIDDFSNKVSEEKQKTIDQLQEELVSLQRENVTILGIFAAIVSALIGNIVFSCSILQNINDLSKNTGVIIALTIGIVFFNITYLLVYFIRRIIEKNGESPWKSVIYNYSLFILGNLLLFCALIYLY